MATFLINKTFRVPKDYAGRTLVPGAVYLAGHSVDGLTSREAAALLAIAPDGALTPVDATAKAATATFEASTGGTLPTSDRT